MNNNQEIELKKEQIKVLTGQIYNLVTEVNKKDEIIKKLKNRIKKQKKKYDKLSNELFIQSYGQ